MTCNLFYNYYHVLKLCYGKKAETDNSLTQSYTVLFKFQQIIINATQEIEATNF